MFDPAAFHLVDLEVLSGAVHDEGAIIKTFIEFLYGTVRGFLVAWNTVCSIR
jgi:hypothetical protein